jgi:ferredoxin
MSLPMPTQSLFEAFLRQHDAAAWTRSLDTLAPSIHPVDRDATRVWFSFFPLPLAEALGRADDADRFARRLLIQGEPRLSRHVDTSHRFMYGHRLWPAVKRAILQRVSSETAPPSLDLAELIRDVARAAARDARVDAPLATGIVAVGLMTLQQVGVDALTASRGVVAPGGRLARLSPDALVRERARDDRQGLFGFLKGVRKEYTVTFDENRDAASFPLINGQHLTTAAANDTRDYSADPRCFAGGPIPVECRTAACGTCWVGVLGGREKLSPVEDLESRRIKEFGYIDTPDPQPSIRLACMAQASGNVTVVIPRWNGVFGRYLKAGLATAAKS